MLAERVLLTGHQIAMRQSETGPLPLLVVGGLAALTGSTVADFFSLDDRWQRSIVVLLCALLVVGAWRVLDHVLQRRQTRSIN